MPRLFLDDQFMLYVDADEFLILPPGVSTIRQVFDRLDAEKAQCVVASIVEFFPESIDALRREHLPASLPDLLDRYGNFQPVPVVRVDEHGAPEETGPSKSSQLFRDFGVHLRPRNLVATIRELFAPRIRKSPRFTTPIIRQSGETFLVGTHRCNRPAPGNMLLTIAHFVFTAQFRTKIDRARSWRSHVNGADKYDSYLKLFEKMARRNASFLDPASVRFRSADQLVEAGLMRW
jgi:hypothetical protein